MSAKKVGSNKKGEKPSPGKHLYWVPYPRPSGENDNEVEVDERYVPKSGIGGGVFGFVCLAEDKLTPTKVPPLDPEVAIKKVSDVFAFKPLAQRLLREVRLLRQIRHPFIVAMKDLMQPPRDKKNTFEDIYIVYNKMDCDLLTLVSVAENYSNYVTPEYCKLVLNQILRGLKYLHSANVLHRDIKPDNILVEFKTSRIEICDFGLGRIIADEMTQMVASANYRAPELALANERKVVSSYDTSIDIWSVGCLFAEMLQHSPNPLFDVRRDDNPSLLMKIAEIIPKPDDDDESLAFIESPICREFVKIRLPKPRTSLRKLYPKAPDDAIDLLEKMLTFDPRKRISAAKALEHPYMADITVDVLAQKFGLTDEQVNILKDDTPPNIDINEQEIESVTSVEELRPLMWKECVEFNAQHACA